MTISKFTALSFLFLIIFNISGSAQNNLCSVSGQVLDKNGRAIEYASVAIYADSRPISGAMTDGHGKFSIRYQADNRSFHLSVEFIGYAKKSIELPGGKSKYELGKIVLEENTIILGEAVVSARSEVTKSTVEHTTLNGSANMTASKGSAIDILSTASSVTILNDAISIRGNSNILILIDGVPTTMSDLSAIPAANIKNIEIITNPDASYDAEGTGGIINIISRKESSKGFSGIVSSNYGFNHFITANAAFSYRAKKASYRFNYNTKYEDDVINSTLKRIIHSSGSQTLQQMQSTRYVFNTNIGLGADFRINPQNILNFDLKCILPRRNVTQDLHNVFIQNQTERSENRHNDVTWNRENIEAAISYRHVIKPEISDITLKGSVSKIWGHRPSYYFLDEIQTSYSNSGGSPFISSLQADFMQKFRTGTLTAGVKLTYRRNDIYHEFYSIVGNEWMYSEALSNDLIHTELIPAAYILYSSRVGKNFTYKVGVRGEFSTVRLNSAHENLKDRNNDLFIAPTLSGIYKIADNQELSMAFSRRIGRPAYPQLNPYMSMVDATTFEQGNMHLSPEKASKLDLSYSLKSKYVQVFTDAYLNHVADYISQITTISEGLLITTYLNGKSDLKAGIDISIKLKPFKWMNATISANTFHINTKGIYDGIDISNSGLTNNSNLLLDFMPAKATDIQLQYFVSTPQYFPQFTTALTHYMNAGVKQKFLKGAMSVSVLITDMFNTNRWKISSSDEVFDLTNISTNKSRMLWLGISYNFNSFKAAKGEKKQENDRSLIRLGNI